MQREGPVFDGDLRLADYQQIGIRTGKEIDCTSTHPTPKNGFPFNLISFRILAFVVPPYRICM